MCLLQQHVEQSLAYIAVIFDATLSPFVYSTLIFGSINMKFSSWSGSFFRSSFWTDMSKLIRVELYAINFMVPSDDILIWNVDVREVFIEDILTFMLQPRQFMNCDLVSVVFGMFLLQDKQWVFFKINIWLFLLLHLLCRTWPEKSWNLYQGTHLDNQLIQR